MGLRKQLNKIKIPYVWLLALPELIYFTGVAMNAIVMAFNNGQMPVQWPGGCSEMPFDGAHVCMVASTRLRWMADWIVMPNGVASPGDMFFWLGQAISSPFLHAWAALVIRDAWVRRR